VLLAALDRLLSEGVSLAHVEHRGLTALHLAALHGLGRIVERLLREGADPGARDRLGRTPHDLALIRGFVDIAALFQTVRPVAPKPMADVGGIDAAAPASSGVLPSLARLLKPRDP
jgi:ankyrin repeat protein